MKTPHFSISDEAVRKIASAHGFVFKKPDLAPILSENDKKERVSYCTKLLGLGANLTRLIFTD